MKSAMDEYSNFREKLKGIIGGKTPLFKMKEKSSFSLVKEKGRKTNYHEFNLLKKEWIEKRRDLNMNEYNSFLEVSLRAAACPMPLNIDVWDGLRCPYRCAYCFADTFRASLYSSFFDNTKNMGLRNCSESFIQTELEKIMSNRGKDPHSLRNPVSKAIAMEIPMRLGIRFEDFTKAEKKKGVSLFLLKELERYKYPLMINTKSDIWEGEYLDILARNNSAIHITIITSDDVMGKLIEPGAPLPSARFEAAKRLTEAGVRVVARIEPYMALINDRPEDIENYIQWMEWAGIKHMTADAYSYSAGSVGVQRQFESMTNLDFERMFLLTSDSQPLGSLALSKFLDCFREKNYSVSTFDGGNIPDNSQMVCCEVEDRFPGAGFNYGSMVSAARFIMERAKEGKTTSWRSFNNYVMENGGYLSENLRMEVMELWNNEGGTGFQLHWIPRFKIVGTDRFGNIWSYNKNEEDYREVLWNGLM